MTISSQTNSGLADEHIGKIRKVFESYPSINAVILYGSRAKGTYRNGSDIDLTLQGNRKGLQQDIYRISDDLEELMLPYTFDLSIFDEIENPNLLEHIERVGVIFFPA